ncbi:BLUF domain-containing protein [Erythrobacter crassostreae]|uniref:BLUF domain-containing protein n=1 Tax=Erythrobacter crassostreae TaxID=2828328 RepID=A0A9X1F506_9SPHN|nr:BLUF domain-containing protein [Erythrobacter crassostrea]MBV7259618.1 BLUF domain-containing protein [Erythrobacter crassostrea]
MAKSMIQIVYTSVAADDLPQGEVFKIVSDSANRNADRDLTGFLCFSKNRFFQILEGDPSTVDALMAVLKVDPRHHSVEILDRSPIKDRAFPKWRMKRVPDIADLTQLEEAVPGLKNAPSTATKALSQFLSG